MDSYKTNHNEKNNKMDTTHSQDLRHSNVSSFLDYLWGQFIILFEQENDRKIVHTWFSSLKLTGWNERKKY